MIAYIRLQRFKCFRDQTVPLSPLTILAGANNTGKSSVIQALLLLRQGFRKDSLKRKEIPLNGPLVHLGTARDVFCQWAEENNITISLALTNRPDDIFQWKLAYEKESPDALFLKITEGFTDNIPSMPLFNNRFAYLGAERIGPQLTYPVSEVSSETMHIGSRGEFTAHCLHQFGNEKIKLSSLLHSPQDQSHTLLFQVEEWIKEMIPGIMMKSDRIAEADILRMSIRNYEKDTDYMRPTNVGFGISYCLPIVVAAIMSDKGTMLIVENPEAHLHPKAQSNLGLFLSRVAAVGVQVIIETHSDHVLNGVRIATKDKIIKEKDISINFFNTNYELLRPSIDSEGRINIWPEGFFDQIEKDLQELI